MTKSTRNLLVLVGSVTILTLALFAVGPVLAQTGSGGNNGQGGNTVVVSPSDTLGTLVTRYNLTGSNLRDFLSLNANLPLVPGQRVTFPPGVTVNIPTTGQSSSSSQGQGSTSSSNGSSSSSNSAAGAATSTATGTPAANNSSSSSNSSNSSSSNSSSNGASSSSANSQTVRTYVVKQGDTLGTLLNDMSFQASVPATGGSSSAANTSTPVATVSVATSTPMATVASTSTPMATVAATSTPAAAAAAATSTPMATVAATTAATSTPAAAVATVASTGTPVATTAANSSSSSSSTAAGGPTDAQLQQFVRLNSALRFGVVVSLPAGVPATGGNNQGTNGTNGTSGTSGSNGSNGTSGTSGSNGSSNTNGSSSAAVTNGGVTNSLASKSGQAALDQACSNGAPKGFGYYRVRSGDSLQSISSKFNVPVSTILELNRGSAFAKGNIILLPGSEAPGLWNVQPLCDHSPNAQPSR